MAMRLKASRAKLLAFQPVETRIVKVSASALYPAAVRVFRRPVLASWHI